MGVPRRPPESLSIIGAALLVLLAAAVGVGLLALAGAVESLRASVPFESAFAAVRRDPALRAFALLGAMSVASGVGVLVVYGPQAGFRGPLAWTPVPLRVLALAVVGGLALHLPLTEIVNLGADLVPRLAPDEMAQHAVRRALRVRSFADAILVPLSVIVIPAVSEEMFFRGVLLPGLEARHGPRIALGVSSVLFGLTHGGPLGILYASLAGWVLGVLRIRTRSIWPSVAMHGAANALPVLLAPEIVRIEGFNTVGPDVYHLPLPLVLTSALVTAIAVALIVRWTDEADRA